MEQTKHHSPKHCVGCMVELEEHIEGSKPLKKSQHPTQIITKLLNWWKSAHYPYVCPPRGSIPRVARPWRGAFLGFKKMCATPPMKLNHYYATKNHSKDIIVWRLKQNAILIISWLYYYFHRHVYEPHHHQRQTHSLTHTSAKQNSQCTT